MVRSYLRPSSKDGISHVPHGPSGSLIVLRPYYDCDGREVDRQVLGTEILCSSAIWSCRPDIPPATRSVLDMPIVDTQAEPAALLPVGIDNLQPFMIMHGTYRACSMGRRFRVFLDFVRHSACCSSFELSRRAHRISFSETPLVLSAYVTCPEWMERLAPSGVYYSHRGGCCAPCLNIESRVSAQKSS